MAEDTMTVRDLLTDVHTTLLSLKQNAGLMEGKLVAGRRVTRYDRVPVYLKQLESLLGKVESMLNEGFIFYDTIVDIYSLEYIVASCTKMWGRELTAEELADFKSKYPSRPDEDLSKYNVTT